MADQEANVENVAVVDGVVPTPAEEETVGENKTPEDALHILLSAKPVRQTVTVRISKREGLAGDLDLQLRSLTDREFKSAAEEASSPTSGNRENRRVGGGGGNETDQALMMRLIVAKAIKSPDFNAPEVLKAHSVQRAEQVVHKLLLPGEISLLAEYVTDLSGWNDNAVKVISGNS